MSPTHLPNLDQVAGDSQLAVMGVILDIAAAATTLAIMALHPDLAFVTTTKNPDPELAAAWSVVHHCESLRHLLDDYRSCILERRLRSSSDPDDWPF